MEFESRRFEARELKSYAEPVTPGELKVGEVYFSLSYHDEHLLIPELIALIFIGRDVYGEGDDSLCFQEYSSYRRGVRYNSADGDEILAFQFQSPDQIKHIFQYEQALDRLMWCALERRKASRDR